jgi:hypothetical protein
MAPGANPLSRCESAAISSWVETVVFLVKGKKGERRKASDT